MLSTYAGETILAVALGVIGGVLAHIKWLIELGRDYAQRGKTPSMAKRAQPLRMSLTILSAGLGGAVGFIVALVVYNSQLGLSTLIAASVVCGLGGGALVRFLGAHGVTG